MKTFKEMPFNQLGKAGYNRGINRSWVNEIKREWRDDLEGPAKVSFRDGKYWIIDHQHQIQAKYELNGCDPNMMVMCEVYTGLTYEQEADLYYRLNTSSRPLSFADKIKGRIEAKDAEALKFRDVIESCGYIIGGGASTSLNALRAAWVIFKKDDGEKLTRILRITKASWPENPDGVQDQMIKGVSLFLENHGAEYDNARLVKVLRAVNPKEIINQANAHYSATNSKSYTKPYCTYFALLEAYNYHLHNKLNLVPASA